MTTTPSVSPRWESPSTVEGFRTSPPNEVLLAYARTLLAGRVKPRALDLGCGAARNAIPLAQLGYSVVGTDLSQPMLDGARARIDEEAPGADITLHLCPMAPLPFADASFDLVVAHGIWNLARSGDEFRAAVREAARVARRGAGLFLFTFSRHTIPDGIAPVAGETFVFTQFNGEPCCFLTESEILEELGRAGFVKDPPGPLTEYNRTPRSTVMGPPVLFEGTFRRT